jgi:hypothetical protein
VHARTAAPASEGRAARPLHHRGSASDERSAGVAPSGPMPQALRATRWQDSHSSCPRGSREFVAPWCRAPHALGLTGSCVRVGTAVVLLLDGVPLLWSMEVSRRLLPQEFAAKHLKKSNSCVIVNSKEAEGLKRCEVISHNRISAIFAAPFQRPSTNVCSACTNNFAPLTRCEARET